MDAVVVETILQNLKRSTSLKSESGEELTIPTDQPYYQQKDLLDLN